jgi:antitoxin ParD1/3/4
MPRTSQPVTVTLGEMKDRVFERVESGAYASVSEVVRAGLRALDREEGALDDWIRKRVQESLDDPQPSIPAEEVFARLKDHARRARLESEEG